MNLFKKNQIIIYTFAFMLVFAGYLNYTSRINNETKEVSAVDNQNDYRNESIEEDKEENKTDEVENKKDEEEKNNDDENDKNDEKKKVADIGDATLVNSNDVVTNYYAKSKLERDSMYSQMLETYEKILNSSNSLETQKQSAAQEITKINTIKNSIMICENLIKTKGFENCVVFVNEGSVSVIIGANSLKQEEIAQIQNIISRELNVKIENIHISTK